MNQKSSIITCICICISFMAGVKVSEIRSKPPPMFSIDQRKIFEFTSENTQLHRENRELHKKLQSKETIVVYEYNYFNGVDFDAKKEYPRGIRNNNPCNLVKSESNWAGQVGTDGRFAVFATPEHGIRACAVNLKRYQERHGLDTIEKIVRRFAPPHQNDTKKYGRDLAKYIGVSVSEPLNVLERMPELLQGLIYLENSSIPYPEEMFIPFSIYQNL